MILKSWRRKVRTHPFWLNDNRSINQDKHLVLLWSASWKDGISIYAPGWVKNDQRKIPGAMNIKWYVVPDAYGIQQGIDAGWCEGFPDYNEAYPRNGCCWTHCYNGSDRNWDGAFHNRPRLPRSCIQGFHLSLSKTTTSGYALKSSTKGIYLMGKWVILTLE